MKTKIILLCLALMAAGCSKAEWSSLKSWDAKHKITLYSGNVVIRSWYSSGQVIESEGGMCLFQDDATRQPVYIYGTWTVEIVR